MCADMKSSGATTLGCAEMRNVQGTVYIRRVPCHFMSLVGLCIRHDNSGSCPRHAWEEDQLNGGQILNSLGSMDRDPHNHDV